MVSKLSSFFVSSFYIFEGYLEDRRPASNMDPYVVTSLLAETTILWEPTLEAEALAAKKLQLQVWWKKKKKKPKFLICIDVIIITTTFFVLC